MSWRIKPKVRVNESCLKDENQEALSKPQQSDDIPQGEMGRTAKSSFYRRISRGGSGTRCHLPRPEMEWIKRPKHQSNRGYSVNTMRLINSNPGNLMTNPEREMGRTAQNPEATKVSDEEY